MSRGNSFLCAIATALASTLLSSCQSSSPLAVAPTPATSQPVPPPTEREPTELSASRVAAIFQGNASTVTLEDAAIALAILNLPANDANPDPVAEAASRLLRTTETISPDSLDTDLLQTACIDYASDRGVADLRDISAILAAARLGNDLLDASDVAETASSILPPNASLNAADIAFIPGQSLSCEPIANINSGFAIQLRFFDASLSPRQQAIVQSAANRWMAAIVSDLPDENLSVSVGECFSRETPSLSQIVDDLFIDVYASAIDGTNRTLAQAGPCILRPGSALPVYGVMQFDSADLDALERDGELFTIALHEMAHVLGFGTIWANFNVIQQNDGGFGLADPRFIGSNAVQAYASLGASGSVPVENIGGPGSADSHWRESTFGGELMTSRITSGSNPLSVLSIAHFADLGYEVDLAQADPYTLPSLSRFRDSASLQFPTVLGTERLLYPKRFVGDRH